MAKPSKNDPPVEEPMAYLGFDLELTQKQQLEQLAEQTERSVAGVLRLIIRYHLDEKRPL